MRQRGDMVGPMMFSGIGYAVGFFAITGYYIIFLLFISLLSGNARVFGTILVGLAMGIGFTLCIIIPMIATVGNLMSAAALHLCLMICGGSKQTFDTTFRILCYSQAAVMWVLIIPGGILAAVIWNLCLVVIGIHKAHEVPMQRAVMTVMLPVIINVVLGMIGAMLSMFGLLAGLSRMG